MLNKWKLNHANLNKFFIKEDVFSRLKNQVFLDSKKHKSKKFAYKNLKFTGFVTISFLIKIFLI